MVNDTKAAAAAGSKRSSVEDDGGSGNKISRVDLCSANGTDDDTAGTEDSKAEGEWIYPIQPLPNFQFPSTGRYADRYIIYMAIQEPVSSSFSRGLEKCATTANDDVHAHCFQKDGTRHITMYDVTLTGEQVRALTFSGTDPLPIDIEIQGWKPWKGGCYLGLTPSTTARLNSLLDKIQGLPAAGGKRGCDHLSLYRKRDFEGGEVWRTFHKVRSGLAKHDWGTIQGVSMRIKRLGSEYNECVVLAGV